MKYRWTQITFEESSVLRHIINMFIVDIFVSLHTNVLVILYGPSITTNDVQYNHSNCLFVFVDGV
jgi:hypothetical protein